MPLELKDQARLAAHTSNYYTESGMTDEEFARAAMKQLNLVIPMSVMRATRTALGIPANHERRKSALYMSKDELRTWIEQLSDRVNRLEHEVATLKESPDAART